MEAIFFFEFYPRGKTKPDKNRKITIIVTRLYKSPFNFRITLLQLEKSTVGRKEKKKGIIPIYIDIPPNPLLDD